eukprot:gene3308-4352_t
MNPPAREILQNQPRHLCPINGARWLTLPGAGDTEGQYPLRRFQLPPTRQIPRASAHRRDTFFAAHECLPLTRSSSIHSSHSVHFDLAADDAAPALATLVYRSRCVTPLDDSALQQLVDAALKRNQ